MTIPYWLIGLVAVVLVVLAWKGKLGQAVGNLILFVAVIGFAWFVVIPFFNSFRTVEGSWEETIHGKSLSASDKVASDAQKGIFHSEEELQSHDRYLGAIARTGYTLAESERKARAVLRGAVFGDITFNPRTPVRPEPGSWPQPFRQLTDGSKVPLEVCAPYAVLTVTGTVNPGAADTSLNVDSGASGWAIDKPETWNTFQTVEPDAPFMALLIRQGLNGKPEWDWKEIGKGQFQMVLERSSGCAALYYAFNNLAIEPGGDPWATSFTDTRGQMIGWLAYPNQ